MKNWIAFIGLLLLGNAVWAQHLQVNHLQCEQKENPSGIENLHPHLSWQLQSDQRSILQTAYRILVADDPELLYRGEGNIYDSKKVNSDASIQVNFAGIALQAVTRYYWKVMVWDNRNNQSGWSETASWQMGLLQPDDWKNAQWIAYEKMADSNIIAPYEHGKGRKELGSRKDILPLLRKEFAVSKPVKAATLFICGLGQFEVHLNGQKVGDHFLDPAWTQFDKEAQYVSFDVGSQLKQAGNTIGVMLGNGFYYIPGERYRKLTGGFGYPKMICRLAISYTDGTTENIVSDNSWKAAPGPIIFSSIYGGEDYDATKEQRGWDAAKFEDNTWRNVVLINNSTTLKSQLAAPLKVMDSFNAKSIIHSDSGNFYVYDMSQNASAIFRLTVLGKRGDTVRIWPAELMGKHGTINQKNTGSPVSYSYILKGDGIENWQPRFSYVGYRYLAVEKAIPAGENNRDHLPEVIDLKGLHTRNAAPEAGSFSSSNELFNQTDTLIKWSIANNLASVFTDCPTRERLGWLEQDHLMGNAMHYNFDISGLYKKAVHDMITAQTADGLVPTIAPEFHHFGDVFRDSPEWGSSSILMPWYYYQWYGDKDLLVESYDMMKRYAAYLQRKAGDSNLLVYGLSDWYDLGPEPPGFCQLTTKGITATAIYYYDLTILHKVATLLHKKKDAVDYENLAATVKLAFNKVYFNSTTKQYGTGSQAGNAIAVYCGLVDEADKNAVIDNIVKDIHDHNNSMTAGDIGYRYLLKALAAAGRSDLIYDMNNRDDVPGYGMQLKKGATALTESWQALPTVSNDHFMLGHLMEWFYESLAGIGQADDGIGFNKIEIKPEPVGDVTNANASFLSPYGLVNSAWSKADKCFQLDVNIPANTRATIYLPSPKDDNITINGQALKGNTDVKFIGFRNGKTIVKTGSGHYHFNVN